VAACAVTALATVFSVQQGEHGPLVIYKLHVPDRAAPAAERVPAAEPVIVIPSRAPTVLGTVVMPPGGLAPPAVTVALPSPVPQGATLGVAAEEAAPAAAVTWEGGDFVSLKQVNDEIVWRRETAASLPEVPFAPRF
jgi:hypothetical protein